MRARLAIWVFLLVLAPAAPASALTIRGTVENGTTGAKGVDVKIVVINPSEGMEEVTEVQSRGGRFEIPNLDPAPMYMLRARYAGIEYNTPVQLMGGQDADVAVTVYEATTSWEGVRVTVPHLAASRQGDWLFIEQLYEIVNETTPRRTIGGEGGAFRLYLPADMDSLTHLSVTSMGVPIDRSPEPTDVKDVYSIDYPIRPGITRVNVNYVVPYRNATYTLPQKFLQDIAHITVFAVDPSMKVTSTSHTFEGTEEVHGMTAYTLHGVKANGDLVLTFEGGSPDFAGIQVDGQGGAHAGENVIVIPGDEESTSIFLMITVLLVLAGVIGMAMRDRHDPLSDPKVLRGHYGLLVSRLARLDDLRAAEAIPNDAYRAAREDLMGRLGALAMHLRSHGGLHHRAHAEKPEPTHQTKAR
jgi:hypothetical protein